MTTLLSAIPSMSQAFLFPNYADNSKCLLNPSVGCEVIRLNVAEQGFVFNLENNPAMRVTRGSIRIQWPADSRYTQLMHQNVVLPAPWNAMTPLGAGYMFKVTDDKMRFKLRLRDIATGKEMSPTGCEEMGGDIRMDTRFYRADIGDGNGVTCTIPYGQKPIDLTVYTVNRTTTLYMKDPNATDRSLFIPGPRLELITEGLFVDQHGNITNKFTQDRRRVFMAQEQYYIQLNERICKISTATTNIDFGTISETARGKQREVKMPFTVQCAGKAVPNQSNFTGVKNHLLGFRVEAKPQRAGDPTKVSLVTDGQVRDDLYVEGSYLGGQQCGVAPLQTNKSLNKFDQPIELGTGQSVSTNQPTIYWRLCADPKDGKNLKTGSFSGQAVVDIEYN